MNGLIPEGFRELRVSDDFVGLIGPLCGVHGYWNGRRVRRGAVS